MIIRNRTTWLYFFIPSGMNRSVEDAIIRANSASRRDAPPVEQVASLQDAGLGVGIVISTERQSRWD
ncbi:MAG: hypothetical protein LBN37_03165 [Bacteroidales bacterium]|nr:hypothetical protein [Bacteroidales bacterium]